MKREGLPRPDTEQETSHGTIKRETTMEQDMILYETPLLDELEEIIYVSDIRDYSLLYLNRAGRS